MFPAILANIGVIVALKALRIGAGGNAIGYAARSFQLARGILAPFERRVVYSITSSLLACIVANA